MTKKSDDAEDVEFREVGYSVPKSQHQPEWPLQLIGFWLFCCSIMLFNNADLTPKAIGSVLAWISIDMMGAWSAVILCAGMIYFIFIR